MLSDEKILITGPAGQIAFPLAASLARDNDVWGIARFGDAAQRERVEAARRHDACRRPRRRATSATCPTDFTYVLHLAADFSVDDYDARCGSTPRAPGFVLEHCRNAKAALVMSTVTVYKPHPDPWHAFRENDPLGDVMLPRPAAVLDLEDRRRGASRATAPASFDLPVTIARMNAAYGEQGGLPLWHLDAIAAGEPVKTRWDPMPYSPIHDDDIVGAGRAAARRGERAGHHRELVRRRRR